MSFNGLQSNMKIHGKWNKNTYTIGKIIGKGAVGYVYEAYGKKGKYAIKVGFQSLSVTSEVNAIQKLQKAKEGFLGPSFIEVDDFISPKTGETIPFYVMELIEGVSVKQFLLENGVEWLDVLVLQLLRDLENIHELQYIYGDLKVENMLVQTNPKRIRLVDVGGVTPFHKSVKEFTDFYDRGYWGLGERKAEPTYDLFSLAMSILTVVYGAKFKKTTGDNVPFLKEKLRMCTSLSKRAFVIERALLGYYPDAKAMRTGWLESMKNVPISAQRTKKQVPQTKSKKSSIFFRTVETTILLTLIFLLYFMYFYYSY